MADCPNSEVDISRKDRRGLNRITHGHSRGGRVTSEWSAWKGMKQRCYLSTNKRFRLYGGRGIQVCDRWRSSFEAFLADMGPKPSPKHSLDRIDVDGDYEPGNCRWATQKAQCRNQRRNRMVRFEGEEMTLAAFAERTGIDRSHLSYHLDQGRTPEDAVRFIRRRRTNEPTA